MNYQYRAEQERALEHEQDRANEAAVKAMSKSAAQPAQTDPAAAQLLVLFRMSDKRGQELLLAIAGIHAARYPRDPK